MLFEVQLEISKQAIVPAASAKLFEEVFVYLLRLHSSFAHTEILHHLETMQVSGGLFPLIFKYIHVLHKQFLTIFDCVQCRI